MILNRILNIKMFAALIMGFSCGVPLLLTMSVLQAWMKQENIDLGTIGIFSLVGLPYTLKFLWSPIFDRFTIPFLGRRKGWLFISQIFLIISIVLLGFTNPAKSPFMVAFTAFLVTFFSASQDIVVDAYRREDLKDEELGLGSSMYIYGYRAGMLLASGGGLILSDFIPFSIVYLLMAVSLIPPMLASALSPEPILVQGQPKTIKDAVIEPLKEYFSRDQAILILVFIILYKIGDTMASAMTIPFYLDIGFTKTEIGSVVKIFGFWATLVGVFIGGVLILKFNIKKSLWIFGILQALSTACFSSLALVGNNIYLLSFIIAFENISSGMGSSAYTAFMASMTDRRFTATQYALLSSLMGIPRVIASAPTGFIADYTGWVGFFIFCTIIAIPGIIFPFYLTDLTNNLYFNKTER